MTQAVAHTVRVWVPDVWDVVPVEVTSESTVTEVKAEALERAMGGVAREDLSDFLVKFRGALVEDESQTLASLGVPHNAPLIVLPARRQPVK